MPEPQAEERALQLFVAGAGLGVVLSQRGLLVLHGSAVEICGRAVAFVGGKGSGKSTTAAFLCQRGHDLLSDELLAVRLEESGPMVLPGMSQLRLWHDVLVSVGCSGRTAHRVRSGIDKFAVNVEQMARSPVPLDRIFILEGGDAIELATQSRPEAFLRLLPHLYVHRFGSDFLRRTGAAVPFGQLGSLLTSVEAKRLSRMDDIGTLPELMALVEKDVKDLKNAADYPAVAARTFLGQPRDGG